MLETIQKKKLVDFFLILLCFALPIVFYWEVISQNVIMVTGDGINFFVPKIFQYETISSGEIPLWNSYVITGISLIADPNNTYFYPLHALALLLPTTLYTNLYYVIHLGLAGLFTYLFLKQTADNRLIALAGAVVFSSSIVIGGSRREHGWVYTSVIWVPLVLYFIQSYIKTGRKRNIIFSGFAMTIQFFGGNPQLALYSDIVAFLYFVYFLITYKFPVKEIVKSLALWMTTYLSFSAIALVPMVELIIFSARANNSQIFCLLSSSWELLLMTIFPNIFGSLAHPLGNYRSAEISIELYLGIIPLFYALYAARRYFSNQFVKFASFAVILAFLYSSACNIPFLGDLVQKIPLLNFFRVQSRVLFVYAFFSICCFAYGISDIRKPEAIKQLLRHNVFMLGVLLLVAAIIPSTNIIPIRTQGGASLSSFDSSWFGVSAVIAAANCLLIGILYLIKNNEKFFEVGSGLAIVVLLGITFWDVGRFSWMHPETTLDSMMKTEEVETLKGLLRDESYRVISVYDNYGESAYQQSGLVNNWSMVSRIRNIKGRTEFENPRLNELLVQSESRDNGNINELVSDGDILAMLSVRYVLNPIDRPQPESIPSLPDTEALSRTEPVDIPGNSELFVHSTPVSLDIDRYYRVDFEVSATAPDVDVFYLDFYGGPTYDWVEQQQFFSIRDGVHQYTTVIYSGDEALPPDVFLRFVSKSNSHLVLSNLKVTKLAPATENPDYTLVTRAGNYNIFELKRAQKILYIPREVKTIEDDDALRKNPDEFPEMDQISYIKDFQNSKTGGSLDILSIKNNSLTARVESQNDTFVNHAQSLYPGWKAFVDGEPTSIYLVNGVIQGIEVPAGEHLVQFVYDPLSLKVGATISLVTLFLTIGFSIYEKTTKAKNVGQMSNWNAD